MELPVHEFFCRHSTACEYIKFLRQVLHEFWGAFNPIRKGLRNRGSNSAHLLSAWLSVQDVPSSIARCDLKSLFRLIFFPCIALSSFIYP